MKRKYIIWSVIGILIIVFFPAYLFGRLDLLKAAQGYHLKSDYNFYDPLGQLYPGIRIVVDNYNPTNRNLAITTSKYYPQNKVFTFELNDEVTIYLNTSVITPASDGATNSTAIKGKIVSVDDNYKGILEVIQDTEQIYYIIEIDNDDKELLNINYKFGNVYERDGDGSMALRVSDGFASVLIDKSAIVETNIGSKYVCVISESLRQNKLFYNNYIELVKPRFQQVFTGKRVYMLNNQDNREFIEIVNGISEKDEYSYPLFKNLSEVSENSNLDCSKK
jgi:hypothetical protein